ncbi:pilus assembly protein TadG-related protein [Nocardioides sp. GXQ0305]|uniref:pilus assembly protein TadG-related protein n=1 Tax=Nocardioides sp. GXQ0305 TaxID=3423912 RepID=UPI003D7DC876
MNVGERASRAWRRRRQRAEEGYAAILTAAVLASGTFFVLAAFSVDVSNWYNRMEQVQRAADAAALAGVPYLPQDLTNAGVRARQVAARNGFDDLASDVTVDVRRGDLPSRLEVTITTDVGNTWGSMFGVDSTTVSRTAVADYQGPAPMGSPCNTFGNEPPSGTGSSATPHGATSVRGSFSNCTSTPQFWATLEGPQTGKVQGDRYQTKNCEDSGVDGCSGLTNTEYDEFGYVFLVQVRPSAVNTDITLQLFDPTFYEVGQRCEKLPGTGSYDNNSSMMNPYVTNADGRVRYSDDHSSSRLYCTGDSYPGASPRNVPTTSFVLRQQVDSQNPTEAPVQNDTSGSPCIRQYTGDDTGSSVSANTFKEGRSGYDANLVPYFHNWADLCTFRPTRAGDYYLQVRTNVSAGGSCTGYVCRGNTAVAATTGNTTTGGGSNSFAMRARTASGMADHVSVSGYNHMPIFVNADTASPTFNLIRVLPGAAGQFIRFSYFDAGDAASNGSVRVLPPTDATGSITSTPFPGNCRSFGGSAGGSDTSPITLSNCTAPFTQSGGVSRNNGKQQTIDIPVPADYTCNYASAGGCWYRVQVGFGTGTVNDVTTWDAAVIGDPLRLVE